MSSNILCCFGTTILYLIIGTLLLLHNSNSPECTILHNNLDISSNLVTLQFSVVFCLNWVILNSIPCISILDTSCCSLFLCYSFFPCYMFPSLPLHSCVVAQRSSGYGYWSLPGLSSHMHNWYNKTCFCHLHLLQMDYFLSFSVPFFPYIQCQQSEL